VYFLWDKLNEGIVISYSPYSCIIFSASALGKLREIISKKINICESGGLLLGFIRGNHFDIRDVTIPYKNDFSSHSSFIRKDKKHLNIFQTLQKKNKDITYIGEWHTHSEDSPRPSAIDLREWNIIKSTRSYPIVFMILGNNDFYITVK
jgi:integrative and conjugative element protein (TIGR02256 family)